MPDSPVPETDPGRPALLTRLCRTVFESLPRTDQRRWAEVYVSGLVSVPGRKSIRRISEHVVGRSAEQCLQQFVNQSPWNWVTVRHVLARTVEPVVAPRAWVIQEIEFPKEGQSSVGVATQFVPGAGRTLNCQLALTTWIAGDDGAVPVNWRLVLPAEWDDDDDRRVKARLPDSVRHRPAWQHILDSVDEMTASWDMTPRPVVGDLRHERRLEPLLRGLEARGLPYAVRITERTPVGATAGGASVLAGALLRSAVRELVALGPRDGRREARGNSSIVAVANVPTDLAPAQGDGRVRRVVARWPRGRAEPAELWLTTVGLTPMPALLGLLDVVGRTAEESGRLRQECGLDHFEGRSYRGWHHHVTLASVAQAYRQLLEAERGPLRLRPAQ